MKNYYYNPKTQDLTIFDTESKEMLVLEVLKGIRVLTSSEIDRPTNFRDDDPARDAKRERIDLEHRTAARGFTKARKCGKCGKTGHRSDGCPSGKASPAKKGRSGQWTCKNCGEKGHSAKTCKNPPKVAPPQLPDSEIQEIAREERHES